ncbi:MAG: hypothetical protein L6Q71_08925, partial [Planctomycetes bacterium]|nr:hypothetical protein [Planctomycetota bacterium]
LAARLCGNAEGAEILVGMGTLDQVKAYYAAHPEGFDLAVKFKSKGDMTVKGITSAVPVATVAYE